MTPPGLVGPPVVLLPPVVGDVDEPELSLSGEFLSDAAAFALKSLIRRSS